MRLLKFSSFVILARADVSLNGTLMKPKREVIEMSSRDKTDVHSLKSNMKRMHVYVCRRRFHSIKINLPGVKGPKPA